MAKVSYACKKRYGSFPIPPPYHTGKVFFTILDPRRYQKTFVITTDFIINQKKSICILIITNDYF